MAGPVQRCTVCNTENDIIRLTCRDCGAVLRDRVAALNLFETGLGVLIEPAETFLRIARSEQRNYILLLFTFTGALLYTVVLASSGIGDAGIHVGVLILSYFVGAPLFGIPIGLVSAYIAYLTFPVAMPVKRWKLHRSLDAWALVPVAFTAPVVIVLAFAIFGQYLFSLDYTALEYKPEVFYVLAGIEALSLVTGLILCMRAFRVFGMPAGKAAAHAVWYFVLLAGSTALVAAAVSLVIEQNQFPL